MNICEIDVSSNYFLTRLKRFSCYPSKLYVAGDISIFERPIDALIGSRHISERDLVNARKVSEYLSRKDRVILSGMAIGADTETIKSALRANGKVCVVLPAGLNQIYPPSNHDLALQILAQGGCLISSFEPDQMVQRYTFLQRDRLIAMLADRVIAISANPSGGTAYTIRYANTHGVTTALYQADQNHALLREKAAISVNSLEQLDTLPEGEAAFNQITLF